MDAPIAEGLTADLNAAQVPHSLNVAGAEREAVAEPDRVLDDRQCESVAMGPGIGHGGSALPELLKAIQPLGPICLTAALHAYTQSLRSQLAGSSTQVIELIPPQVATELTPGQSTNPQSMPLGGYVGETMSLLPTRSISSGSGC